MLALGVFSARRQLRAGHSLVSEAGIGRGRFLTLPGERGSVPRSVATLAGTGCMQRGCRQGAPLHPEREAAAGS